MQTAIISVIVPVYNSERYLSNCLDSILAQVYKNFEIVLVNDGSTDKSGDICEFYSEKDRRIKYLKKNNGGVSSARNLGISSAIITGPCPAKSSDPCLSSPPINTANPIFCPLSVFFSAPLKPKPEA